MTFYKQNDIRWAFKRLGNTKLTLGRFGCFVTCLANLSNLRPDEANKRLTEDGLINKDGLILNSTKVAKVLGLKDYKGVGCGETKPNYDTIAEVDYNRTRSGVQQHFVIILKDGKIFCPLKGWLPDNYYTILSYRLYQAKENQMEKTISIKKYRKLEKRYKFTVKKFGQAMDKIRSGLKDAQEWIDEVDTKYPF